MKTLSIQNASGETIKIKCDPEGRVRICHSDIDAKQFGELHEYAKRAKQPKLQSFLGVQGIDTSSEDFKKVAHLLGGYMVLRGKTYMVSAEEVVLIHDAITKAGGIVPNWSSRP